MLRGMPAPPSPALAASVDTPGPAHGASSVTQQAMDALTALLPYALGAFGVSLPFLVWLGSHASNLLPMAGSFVAFASAWAMFYAVVNWLKTPAASDLSLRGRVHVLGGLSWAVATAQIALFADAA